MADSKRSDVMRNQFPAATRAANRAIGNDIYCCTNQQGATTTEFGGSEVVCVLDQIIVADTYRRIFLSATIASPHRLVEDPEFPFSMSMAIIDLNSGLVMVPSIFSRLEHEPKTITSAVDVGPGTYEFGLMFGAGSFGLLITTGEAAMQAIMGQVVVEQQCISSGSA